MYLCAIFVVLGKTRWEKGCLKCRCILIELMISIIDSRFPVGMQSKKKEKSEIKSNCLNIHQKPYDTIIGDRFISMLSKINEIIKIRRVTF